MVVLTALFGSLFSSTVFAGPALYVTGKVVGFNSTHIPFQTKNGRIMIERKFLNKKMDRYLAKNHTKPIFVGIPLDAISGSAPGGVR